MCYGNNWRQESFITMTMRLCLGRRLLGQPVSDKIIPQHALKGHHALHLRFVLKLAGMQNTPHLLLNLLLQLVLLPTQTTQEACNLCGHT